MSIIEFEIILIAFLLIMAGLISCFETSITAGSRAKIHRLENEGDKRATRVEKLLKKRENVVSVMLLANNAINIIASALTTKFLLDIFGEIGVLYASIFLTIVVIIFGEILPKTIALQYPEKCLLLFGFLIEILYNIFSPIVKIIQKIVDFSIRVLRIKKIPKTKESELEEIRDALDLKAKEGTIFKYDKELLDGVLDLSDTEINEIMVHRKNIESINFDSPIEDILKRAIDIGFTRIPLWKENQENIVAILNVRKLLKSLYFNKGDIGKININDSISQPLFSPNTNTLRSQLFLFRKNHRRLSLVVDEYGSLLGLVTLEDILEEIVGEIKEQDENNQINIIRTKSGIYKVAGKTLVRDLNKKLNLNLPEFDEAFNISTYIINYLQRIPNEREQFVINKINFEIVRKSHNDLILIKISKNKSFN
jgi:Mg2+/Co2+ transporter CorB